MSPLFESVSFKIGKRRVYANDIKDFLRDNGNLRIHLKTNEVLTIASHEKELIQETLKTLTMLRAL